jgi:hypothetical protein
MFEVVFLLKRGRNNVAELGGHSQGLSFTVFHPPALELCARVS